MKQTLFLAAVLSCLGAGRALAWGDVGHEVTGLIAYDRLTSTTKAKVDALLASDPNTLTAPDFPSRATWADKYRTTHRETAAWHFADIEIDHPDLNPACFGFPQLAPGQAASAGLTQDCVVDKIEEFAKELADPKTLPAERLLAFKFLIHFVGDEHQPLHASDHRDEGGNCIVLAPSSDSRSTNLHAFWDTGVVLELGDSPVDIAMRLERDITPENASDWARGHPRDWAMETFAIANKDAYNLSSRPTCAERGSVSLSKAYEAQAQQDAAIQLERAGVRIAAVLNRALGG